MRLVGLFLLPALAASAQGSRSLVLPNHLEVLIEEDFGRPLVRARLRFQVPNRHPALLAFALEVLERSATGAHSRGSFNRALDHAGLALSRTSDAESVTWELVGPPQTLDTGLALLADQVLRPQIDGTAVERARVRLYRDLQSQNPAERAMLRARAKLGAPAGPPPDESLLSQTGEADLEAFLRDLLRPANAVLAIEGSVTEAQARTAAFLHFGTWPDRPAASPPTPSEVPARMTLVPGSAPQAWLGLDLSATPLAFRELLALATPRTSDSGSDLEILPDGFALQRIGGNPLQSLDELRADLENFAGKGLSPQQFDAAKRRHASAQATLGLHPATPVLQDLAAAALAAEIRAMDLPAFNGILRKAFQGSHRHAVLVGLTPKDSADPRIEAFGEVEVWIEGKGTFVRRVYAAKPGGGSN